MPYTVEYNKAENIMGSSITGRIGLFELTGCFMNMIHVAKQENCLHLLSDLSQAELNLSASEYYSFPRLILELTAAQRLNLSNYKHAFVLSKKGNLYNFYENVFVNRGQRIIVFHDTNSAKNWLQGK